MDYSSVREIDPQVADALTAEVERQRSGIQLIASENHVSEAVLEAQGSVLTNKYAEGYPGRRYYGGCDHCDTIESLAIDRAQELWGATHVNVQPHSGTQANQGVYYAMLEPGDRILSLALNNGGHLSHGHPANFAGQLYNVKHYHVDPETGYLNYDEVASIADDWNPDIIVSGYSAYPREIEWDRMQSIATDVDAYHLADIAHISGLVASGAHRSPVGIADFVTASTHKTIRAGRGGIIMCGAEYADAIDKAVFPGGQGGPLMHNIAGKAVGFREALQPAFSRYIEQVVANAKAMGERLRELGYHVVSGGTDTHLLLVDLRPSHPDLSGGDAETALESANITLNSNTVPNETRSAFDPSGIRIGTPAISTRGFDEEDARAVADLIDSVLAAPNDPDVREQVSAEVASLCDENPLYH